MAMWQIIRVHPLTTTEQVFKFILRYFGAHGFPPSQREIADGCYITRGAVPRHLKKLEAQQLITRTPGIPRSIRVLKDNSEWVSKK